jgi:hypothetical protein
LKLVEIVLTVKTRLFFVSVKIYKINNFKLRLGQVKSLVKTVEIVETNQDCQDLLRFVDIY